MFTLLLELLFSWLPTSIWLGVWAVLGVSFFIIVVKIIGIVLDWVFKFIDIFI